MNGHCRGRECYHLDPEKDTYSNRKEFIIFNFHFCKNFPILVYQNLAR